MTTRNLQALFEPRAIALIGASARENSLGAVLARNLMSGGFSGPIWMVNPHQALIGSKTAFSRIADLPYAPDLAVVATPPAAVPGVIAELGQSGCRAAVVITAGFSDPAERQKLLDAARPSLLRIIGPNCLGFLSPGRGVNASFAPILPRPGGLALIAQSGAVTTAAIDWAHGRGLGFSHIITLGDMADVDFGDLLDYLAQDSQTSAILLYVESITDARKFMTAGRIASRLKPVVVLKAGRSKAGSKAAYSHTGALAGSDLVYDAAFRRAGMVRVDSLREMFDAVATLTAATAVAGDRLTIITNGGGAGVMAADALEAQGGRLAPLSEPAVHALGAVLPATWSKSNPIDIIGDASPSRYADALEAVSAEDASDALLVLYCPTALSDSADVAKVLIERAKTLHKPVLTSWLGDATTKTSRVLFAQAAIPTYETPEEAVGAFMHLAQRRRNLDLLDEVPSGNADEPDVAAARAIFATAAAEGRAQLTEPEAKAVLRAYGVPVLESQVARSPADAFAQAAAWSGPYALKILSPDITHKSDVGGVALHLSTPDAVKAAAEGMLARIQAARPKARIDGFILQQMAIDPMARELIIGVSSDPTFGPVVLFGTGGVEVELVADRTMGLPPLSQPLALDMIARTQVAKRLAAWRDRPDVPLAPIAEVLVRVSQLALDFPQIAELDINPLSAGADRVLALDARISLSDPAKRPRSAIRPYPQQLTQVIPLGAAQSITLRAIRPQDADDLRELIAVSSPKDVRFRLGAIVRELPEQWASRLAQIDYDREMALVAILDGDLVGVARQVEDPECANAEIAIIVRSDRQRLGIGRVLLDALTHYAHTRGLTRVWGDVARDNAAMLKLAEQSGFVRETASDPAVVRIAKRP